MANIRLYTITALLVFLLGVAYSNIYDEILPEPVVSGEDANVRFITTSDPEGYLPPEPDNDNEENDEEPPQVFIYDDISEALEEANAGDFLWFMEGEYTINLEITTPLFLMGGFPDDGRELEDYSLDDRQWWHNRVIIEPEGEGSVVTLDSQAAEGLILFDGFEVRGGSGTLAGGGVNNLGAAVMNCFIHDSSSDYVGGGVHNHLGYVLNSVIFDNYAEHYGGGIYNNEGYIQNCTVVRNESKYGSGIYQFAYEPEEGEEPEVQGIGQIVNTVSWYNDWSVGADEGGHWSDIHNYHGDVLYSCFRRIEGSEESIDQDPRLSNPHIEGPEPSPVEGFTLQSDSPLIDAGSTTAENYISLPYDITGRTRITGETIDIGAYEYQEAANENNPLESVK